MASATAKRLFRIQYVSDLHLEFYQKATFPLLVKPAARYLALAGDIGQPGHPVFHSFLEYAHRNWDQVFYIAGNHEYYQKEHKKWQYSTPRSFFETHEALKHAVAPYNNIHYLHHDNPSYHFADQNVTILGTTLWSHVPEDAMLDAASCVNDYNYIPWKEDYDIRRLRPEDTNMIHAKEKENLGNQIDYWRTMKSNIVVLTHHMPSYSFISSKYAGNPMNSCFASHSDDLIAPPVRTWIYGHTHTRNSGVLNGVFVTANPRGYPNEHVAGFSTEAVAEFSVAGDHDVEINPELAAAASGIGARQVLRNSVDSDDLYTFI
jgi:predicted phosphodiesterase